MKRQATKQNNNEERFMTFGEHLEILRQMLFRVLGVSAVFAMLIFFFKDLTFEFLLAPSEWDFCTYRWIESFMQMFAPDFHFEEFHIDLIATELSSQFMTHVTTSCILGLLCASPYVMYEIFRFISPALYDNEKRYSVQVVLSIYLLFMIGVLTNYFIIFPISFRFLGTYSVASRVSSIITLDSYIESFTNLTLVMGVVFQLPVLSFFLAKMGVITSSMLATYRKHALIVIMLVAAIITPPDIMTLILVTIPLYLLYEVSIRVVKWVE
ncbi:MAG: twin-arginine translocase subunit TatC [Bacteroidaceae bacterium]|nr:twin-arginine translocase subunit TatC [Bacteroidaceae bacterium]